MIYDCFTFFNELDLLEIRLEELKNVVDRFVLVEATKTFSNKPKRLFYQENKERFRDFADRIIHVVVDDLPEQPKDSWENQYFQRNAISRGLVDCAPDDIIIISDLDEIPRASAIAGFSGEIAFLEQNLYYYRLNCLCTTSKWAIPVILRYRNLTTPQEVRMYWYDKDRRTEIPTIANGGWHFSYLGDVQDIQLKLNSFSQQDFNTPEVNNKKAIERKIDLAEDLFGRSAYQWTFVKIDDTFPRVIYNNLYKYARYLKARDLEGAIFFDQYSRYKTCAEILKLVSAESSTTLDVGSGADCLLGEFLPNRDITFIDPLIGNLPHRPTYKMVGDAFSPDLDGRTFDYVVSIDTLEHVPLQYRVRFIERLSSLAHKGLILAFPAGDAGDAVGTDSWLNSVYSMAYGKDYRWLEEHLQNGLPSLADTIEQLKGLGWRISVSQNGHTPWMRELLSLTLCGLEIDTFKQTVQELSTYFNRHLQVFDSLPPGYRQILFCARPDAPELPAMDAVNQADPASASQHWDFIHRKIAASPYPKLLGISKSVKEKDQLLADQIQHIAKLEQDISERNELLTKFNLSLSDSNEHIVQLNKALTDSRQYIANIERELAEDREEIARVGQELNNRNHFITILEHKLADQSAHIARFEKELGDSEQHVQDLLTSKSWQMTAPLRKICDLVAKK